MVKGMVFRDGTEYLDRLLQKSYRYEHHLLNYQESKKSGLIPNGLRINKSPSIKPLSKDFNQRWNEILYNAENNLVELLLYESNKVVAKMQIDLDQEIKRIDPRNYDKARRNLDNKHANYKRMLKNRRSKKWENVKVKRKDSNLESQNRMSKKKVSTNTPINNTDSSTKLVKKVVQPVGKNEVREIIIKKTEAIPTNYDRSYSKTPIEINNSYVTDNRRFREKRKNRKIRDTDKVNAEVSNVDIFKNQKDITIVEKGETSIDFKKIGINGIGKEMLNTSKISTRSQKENSYSFLSCDSKSSKTNDCTDEILNTQDGELVDILEELGN